MRELLKYCLEENNQDAWQEFDRRVRRTIRGVVSKRLRYELVEEVTQDAFVKLTNCDSKALRKDWADDVSIFKYVKVVSQSAVIDWLRKNKVLKDANDLEEYQEFPAPPSRHPAEKEILCREIGRCLQTLASDPNFKRNCAIFWLFYLHNYRDSEIAALPAVNLPVRTVQNILQKYVRVVRRKLREGKEKIGEE